MKSEECLESVLLHYCSSSGLIQCPQWSIVFQFALTTMLLLLLLLLLLLAPPLAAAWGPSDITSLHVVQSCHLDEGFAQVLSRLESRSITHLSRSLFPVSL